jgi:hypothetical protein
MTMAFFHTERQTDRERERERERETDLVIHDKPDIQNLETQF